MVKVMVCANQASSAVSTRHYANEEKRPDLSCRHKITYSNESVPRAMPEWRVRFLLVLHPSQHTALCVFGYHTRSVLGQGASQRPLHQRPALKKATRYLHAVAEVTVTSAFSFHCSYYRWKGLGQTVHSVWHMSSFSTIHNRYGPTQKFTPPLALHILLSLH